MALFGNILIIAGIVVSLAGVVCYMVCKDFFGRLLISSIIDGCGFLLIMAGVIARLGFGFPALKVLLIAVTVMIINPTTSHEIARLSKLAGIGKTGELKENLTTD